MRIQHNIMAMNAYRNYTNNVNAMKSSLEKLSSGYKINRAGDDAAGLAISEKMRAQITGLETAQKNAKDGISLVQTAEGALTEVHDMLNRMVELATQSANGTYDNTTDRKQLQKEVEQLKSEINRIADSANFNGIKLLDGSLSSVDTVQAGSAKIELGVADAASFIGTTQVTVGAPSNLGTGALLHKDGTGLSQTTFEVSLNGLTYDSLTANTGSAITMLVGGTTIAINAASTKTDLSSSQLADLFKQQVGSGISIGGVTYTVEVDGDKLKFTMDETVAKSLTNAASFTGNFNVTIKTGATTVGVMTGGPVSADGNISLATSNVKEATPGGSDIYASASQATPWAATDIKDGMVVKIGNENYIFTLSDDMFGKASSVASTDNSFKIVDVRDLANETGTALDTTNIGAHVLSMATTRLTEAAKDNEMFIVGASTTDGRLTFRERAEYGGNGKDGKADLTKMSGLNAQFKVYQNAVINETKASVTVKGKPLTLQIGDTADDYNQLKVNVGDMHATSLGISALSIEDQDSAAKAIESIKNAINQVSDVRGTLGATQNRLDHTINNLGVMTENIQDAESTIRDVDVAEEMMAYTKNNILIQSAQAMLAQANQVPQGVLQLLQ